MHPIASLCPIRTAGESEKCLRIFATSKSHLYSPLETETIQKEKVKLNNKAVLTSRDIDVCKFLLEMKFASVEEIHKKFFKVTLFGFESKGFRTAWRRLNVLEELGVVKALHHLLSHAYLLRKWLPIMKLGGSHSCNSLAPTYATG